MRRVGILIGLLALSGLMADARAEPLVPARHNVTRALRDFVKSYDRKAATAALPSDAHQYRYVLVKGLLGNNYPRYMAKNLAALRDAGLSAEFAPINTAGGVRDNADVIKEMIRTSDKPIVFVTHSKGTVDVTTAIGELWKSDPSLVKDKVRGLVSLNASQGGSPVADYVASHKVTRIVLGGLAKLVGGSEQSILDLRRSVRAQAQKDAPMPTHVVPTVSMVGYAKSAFSRLGPVAAIIKRATGRLSDGLVLPRDAVVPGSDVARLPRDHARSVYGRSGEQLTLGLVRHVLERASLAQAVPSEQSSDGAEAGFAPRERSTQVKRTIDMPREN